MDWVGWITAFGIWVSAGATLCLVVLAWRSGWLKREGKPALVVKTKVREIVMTDGKPGVAIIAIVKNVSHVQVIPREAVIELWDVAERCVERYDWIEDRDPRFEPREVLQVTRCRHESWFAYGYLRVRVIIKQNDDREWSVDTVYHLKNSRTGESNE